MEKQFVIVDKIENKTMLSAEAIQQSIQQNEAGQFYQQQRDKGRDYCYILHEEVLFQAEQTEEYSLTVYSLNEPKTLDAAAKRDIVLRPDETLYIRRIAVIRNGQFFDKLNDIQTKVLDNESQSGNGMITNNKTINLVIRDLHLNDILVIEFKKQHLHKEDGILRDYNRFFQYTPNPFWAYGDYRVQFINQSGKPFNVKQCFFRDEENNVLSGDDQITTLPHGETYTIAHQEYFNNYDPRTEICPFIHFATQATYEELSSYLYEKYYREYDATTHNLAQFAPELVAKLDAESSLDAKLQLAIEFVQNSIYYLYHADFMDGHLPQTPEKTYSTRQGDCKAKTVLLKTILDYLKIDSSIILVNYQQDFFLQHYLPSLFNFNHAILKINLNDKTYFVDATSLGDYGLIDHRAKLELMYYLEMKPNQQLAKQDPYQYEQFCVEEWFDCQVEKNVATISWTLLFRYHSANKARETFKVKNQHELLDNYNNFIWDMLCQDNKYNETEIADYFFDSKVEVLSDDKKLNQFKVCYQTKVKEPYTRDKAGNQYLEYWDRGFLDNSARNHNHKDFPFWLSRNSIKTEIRLICDHKIDTKEKYTNQECEIDNPLWSYRTKKKVQKNGATIWIESKPLYNAALNAEQLSDYLDVERQVRDSNWGLGVDLQKPSLWSKLFG